MNLVYQQSVACGVESLNREKNDALYEKLVAGDFSARQQMIEGNMALVTLRVESLLALTPAARFLRDDLISEGLLGLTKAVNQMATSGPVSEPNPTGYILTGITNRMNDFLTEDKSLCSARTAQRAEAAGYQLPHIVRTIHIDGMTDDMVSEHAIDSSSDASARTFELREFIWSCAELEEEREALRLREQGYTLEEIGNAIGRKKSRVSEMLQTLAKRYDEKLRKLNEDDEEDEEDDSQDSAGPR